MRQSQLLIGFVLLFTLIGCQQDRAGRTTGELPTQGSTAATQQTAAVADASGELSLALGGPGPHLTDAAGTALYALDADTAGEGCVGVCLEAWPPMLISEAQPSVAAGLQPNLVSSVQRPDGTNQVTYANKPLYRYAGDTGAGRTTGHGVDDRWGRWHLVGPGGETVAGHRAPDQD